VSLPTRYEALRSYWSREELKRMGVERRGVVASESAAGATTVRQITSLELNHYMRNTLLRDSDAMSMSHGIELRVPFLDHRLVEFALRKGVSRVGKRVLVDATRDLLPTGAIRRRKQCFALPMAQWMRGPLRSYVDEGLALMERSTVLPAVPLYELSERFERGALQWSRLWQFVVLGHWMNNVLSWPVDMGDAGACEVAQACAEAGVGA
jgi:asparagine synthase (glutamine-hydrolysing)